MRKYILVVFLFLFCIFSKGFSSLSEKDKLLYEDVLFFSEEFQISPDDSYRFFQLLEIGMNFPYYYIRPMMLSFKLTYKEGELDLLFQDAVKKEWLRNTPTTTLQAFFMLFYLFEKKNSDGRWNELASSVFQDYTNHLKNFIQLPYPNSKGMIFLWNHIYKDKKIYLNWNEVKLQLQKINEK